jgi:PadR family transcriptional regulator, regulatory protein AphA
MRTSMKRQENKSRYAILGILTIAPMSGYDLKKFTEKSMNYFWNENYAWIYPTLKQLEQEGLVVSSQEKQEGRPDRHLYTLTEQGRAELRRWLGEPTAFHETPRNEHLLKMFFADQVPLSITIEQMRFWREALQNMLASLEDLDRQASAVALEQEVPQGRPYRLIALSYGFHMVRAQLVWCEETITKLEGLPQKRGKQR